MTALRSCLSARMAAMYGAWIAHSTSGTAPRRRSRTPVSAARAAASTGGGAAARKGSKERGSGIFRSFMLILSILSASKKAEHIAGLALRLRMSISGCQGPLAAREKSRLTARFAFRSEDEEPRRLQFFCDQCRVFAQRRTARGENYRGGAPPRR